MSVKTSIDGKIYLALLNRLNTMSGGYDIVEPNDIYPTDQGQAFIVVQDVRFDPDTPYIGGSSSNEYRGTFSLSVMAPLSWTHAQVLSVAGVVAAHFPKSSKYTYDDTRVEILQTPYYSGNSRRDEGFHRVDVLIPWRAAG